MFLILLALATVASAANCTDPFACYLHGACIDSECYCNDGYASWVAGCDYELKSLTLAIQKMKHAWSFSFGSHWDYIERDDVESDLIALDLSVLVLLIPLAGTFCLAKSGSACTMPCFYCTCGLFLCWLGAVLITHEVVKQNFVAGNILDGNGFGYAE